MLWQVAMLGSILVTCKKMARILLLAATAGAFVAPGGSLVRRAAPATPRDVAAAAAAKEIARFAPEDFAADWPYVANDFRRYDEQADAVFYANPRIVKHIDEGAIGAVTAHYAATLAPGSDVLDLCSSWISHLPPALELGRVVGVGMNADELAQNRRLTEFITRDLNAEPELPFADGSFDAVLNVVSVDYLTQARERK